MRIRALWGCFGRSGSPCGTDRASRQVRALRDHCFGAAGGGPSQAVRLRRVQDARSSETGVVTSVGSGNETERIFDVPSLCGDKTHLSEDTLNNSLSPVFTQMRYRCLNQIA
jgi:hypothetical protein